MFYSYGNISDARNLLKEIGFETNQTYRAAERDIEFIEFIFRDAKPKQFARSEYLAYREIRKDQNENDILNNVREKTERYITACPDSLFFIIQVMGLLRGLSAQLGVSCPFLHIFSLNARIGLLQAGEYSMPSNTHEADSLLNEFNAM